MADLPKMNLSSMDLISERIEQLKQLLPEVATESGIDFDKLRLVLGDEVDEGAERYAFTWPGKADAIRQSQTPSMATLRPVPEDSVNWDETENLYIEGDNLEVLKLLQRSYHGRVKLIYIDPPYNTGNDFVYRDRFGDTIDNYREQAGLASQSNADTSGRYHSDWCSMIYPRLRLARELLADDGVICISMDDHEARNLRLICDEVFGEACFVAQLIWKSRQNKDNRTINGISVDHEYVLVYSKHAGMRVFRGADRDENSYKNPDNDPKGPWASANMVGLATAAARPNLHYDLIDPATGINYGCPDKGWRYDRAGMQRLIDAGLILWPDNPNGRPRRKKYLSELSGDLAGYPSIIGQDLYTRNGSAEIKDLFDATVFDFPKPSELIREMVEQTTSDSDIVLDFFSGSGSCAQAVMRQNAIDGGKRAFICVQLPEVCKADSEPARYGYVNLCEIGKERIRRAGAKIAAEVEDANKQLRLGEEPKPVPDIGFRVLKLDESGIERPKPGELMLDVVKPDRSDEDIIFEMMLKWGLELTLPIEKVDAAGYPCYSVAFGELVCCLAPGLNMQVLDAIADMDPRRVLMLDRNLDDTTKLNAVQAFKRVEERTGREVELRTV